jgi:hypothetical protein
MSPHTSDSHRPNGWSTKPLFHFDLVDLQHQGRPKPKSAANILCTALITIMLDKYSRLQADPRMQRGQRICNWNKHMNGYMAREREFMSEVIPLQILISDGNILCKRNISYHKQSSSLVSFPSTTIKLKVMSDHFHITNHEYQNIVNHLLTIHPCVQRNIIQHSQRTAPLT